MFTTVLAQDASWLDRTLWGNPVWQWLTAVGVVIAAVIVFIAVRALLVNRLGRWAKRTEGQWDDLAVALIADVRTPIVAVIAAWASSQALVLPHAASQALRIAGVCACALQLLLSSRLVIDFGLRLALAKKRTPDGQPDPMIQSGLGIIRFIATLVIGAIVVLLALDNLGVAVTPMIAGLGVGGIAIALAVQSILGDVFASLSILFDKPFMVGDFIIVGQQMGVVEHIGIKTTRVRALSGEQLVFTNSDLLSSRIQNFKRMHERRATFTIGVIYQTPSHKLRLIPRIIREAVEHQPGLRFDRSHFRAYGAYSLDFESVFYVQDPDMRRFLDLQQEVFLEIFDRFIEEGIEFAYPTAVEYQFTAAQMEAPRRERRAPEARPSPPAPPALEPTDEGAP